MSIESNPEESLAEYFERLAREKQREEVLKLQQKLFIEENPAEQSAALRKTWKVISTSVDEEGTIVIVVETPRGTYQEMVYTDGTKRLTKIGEEP